jgi:uncharacterized protein (TIGR03067 family)
MYELALFAALGLGAPAPKEVPFKADELVAEWVVESLTKGGETIPFPQEPADRVAIRFAADGTIAWPDEHGNDRGAKYQSYALDTAVRPVRIDWTTSEPDKPKRTSLGILKIEGDLLTLAIATDGSDRPATFDSSKLNSTQVWVLKRAQKAKD